MPKRIANGKVSYVFWYGGGKLTSSVVTCAQNVFTLCTGEPVKILGFYLQDGGAHWKT